MFETLKNDRLWGCTLSYPNFTVYCIAFKTMIFSFCMLYSFLKKISWRQNFIHVYAVAIFSLSTLPASLPIWISSDLTFFTFSFAYENWLYDSFCLNKMIIGAVALVDVLCARSIWFLLKFVISASSARLDISGYSIFLCDMKY